MKDTKNLPHVSPVQTLNVALKPQMPGVSFLYFVFHIQNSRDPKYMRLKSEQILYTSLWDNVNNVLSSSTLRKLMFLRVITQMFI